MGKQISVRMRCVVTKVVTCEGCTLEQAQADPWAYAVDEQEVEQVDWQVTSATEDK